MDCRRYSAASRHEVLLDEDDFRSFSQALELGDVLLLSQLHVAVLVLWNQFRAPLFWSTKTGLTVLVWSSSTCVSVNTQHFVDSDPHTGLTVLVESVTSSWSNMVRFSISFVDSWTHTGLTVLDNWVLGFDWIRWLSLLLPATNHTSNYLCTKFSVVVEVTHIPSGIWFLQISSQLLSRYNKLGVYRRGWLPSVLFDRTSILSVEQAVNRPNTLYPGAFSTVACTMQDVVCSSQSLADPCGSYSWDSRL